MLSLPVDCCSSSVAPWPRKLTGGYVLLWRLPKLNSKVQLYAMKKYCCLFWLLDPSGAHNSQDPSPLPPSPWANRLCFQAKLVRRYLPLLSQELARDSSWVLGNQRKRWSKYLLMVTFSKKMSFLDKSLYLVKCSCVALRWNLFRKSVFGFMITFCWSWIKICMHMFSRLLFTKGIEIQLTLKINVVSNVA